MGIDNPKSIIFEIKKTSELNSEEINQVNDLFNTVFVDNLKKKRSIQDFKKKYLNNIFKFSFHGLMKFNNKIVGCYNVIPQEFDFFSNKNIFGLSVDTSIEKKFRGNIFNLKKLANIVYSELKKFDISLVYGLANDKFYLVKKKVLGWRDIGEVNYYVSPGNLNFLNLFLLKLILFFLNIFKKKKNTKFYISKVYNKTFKKWRYGEKHQFIEKDNIKGFLRIEKKNKYKIAMILDILPLSPQNLSIITREIIKKYLDVHFVVYFGKLNYLPSNFFLLPSFILKRQTIFSGKIINDSLSKQIIFNPKNWNINLSNFDED